MPTTEPQHRTECRWKIVANKIHGTCEYEVNFTYSGRFHSFGKRCQLRAPWWKETRYWKIICEPLLSCQHRLSISWIKGGVTMWGNLVNVIRLACRWSTTKKEDFYHSNQVAPQSLKHTDNDFQILTNENLSPTVTTSVYWDFWRAAMQYLTHVALNFRWLTPVLAWFDYACILCSVLGTTYKCPTVPWIMQWTRPM